MNTDKTKECLSVFICVHPWPTGFSLFSISLLLLHHVLQRLALREALELGQEETHSLLGPIGGVIGAVRGEEDVFQSVEGVAVGQGFGVEDVERGAFNEIGRASSRE